MTEQKKVSQTSEIIKMCEKLASKYKAPQHYDDLVQEGVLACYEVLAQDDDPHPAQLWRMANRRMYDYLNFDTNPMSIPASDTARKVSRGTGEITGNYSEAGIQHLERTLSYEVVEMDDFMAFAPDHAEEYEDKDYAAYVMSVAVTTLTEVEMAILKARFFEDKSQEELADEYEVSQQTISRWEDEMMKKLRNNL